MNYEQAAEKLKKYDQMQILKYYDELTDEQKSILLDEIDRTDFDAVFGKAADISTGIISPMDAVKISEIEANRARFEEKGLECIRAGKAAALLLAGGQGTRLGISGPKGTCNIGITRDLYIFECLFNNLMEVVKKAGCWIPFFIMTSNKNDKETREFLQEHNYFGYDKDHIYFFVQDMAPSTDFNGKIYMESKYHMVLSPNGNGGWYSSLKSAGYEELIDKLGIEWINIFAVDNVLQKMMDPVFLGATLESGCEVGSKVISKAYPEENVGVMCYRDGHPSIVEYYDLTDEMRYQKDDAGNLAYGSGVILNYLFYVPALKRIVDKKLPLHIAKKKIPYMDENGTFIKPEEPNGNKYENLVLDMIEMMDGCLAFEVDRKSEFAPVKNMHGVDSLDSAREMLKAYGVEL